MSQSLLQGSILRPSSVKSLAPKPNMRALLGLRKTVPRNFQVRALQSVELPDLPYDYGYIPLFYAQSNDLWHSSHESSKMGTLCRLRHVRNDSCTIDVKV